MVDQDIQSLHLLYLTHNQKASYSQLCQYFSAKLRSASFTDGQYPVYYPLESFILESYYILSVFFFQGVFQNTPWSPKFEVK